MRIYLLGLTILIQVGFCFAPASILAQDPTRQQIPDTQDSSTKNCPIIDAGMPTDTDPKDPSPNRPGKESLPKQFYLNPPTFSPSGLALDPNKPNEEKIITLNIGTRVIPTDSPPKFICLEEVDKDNVLIKNSEAHRKLLDDGKAPDKEAGNQFYTGQEPLEIRGAEENEKYFRYSTIHNGRILRSKTTVFPITNIPIGYPSSEIKKLVGGPNKKEKFFSNEVIIRAQKGTTAKQVNKIVKEVGLSFGLSNPDSINIVGYLSQSNSYLVRFEEAGTLKGTREEVEQFIIEFQNVKYKNEIKKASPNYFVPPTSSHWWIDTVGGFNLRPESFPIAESILFGKGAGVAVLEAGTPCGGGGDACPSGGVIPFESGVENINMENLVCYNHYVNPGQLVHGGNHHGNKVAALITGNPASDNVDEGIAPNTTLYRIDRNLGDFQLEGAIYCAREAHDHQDHQIDVINISAGNAQNVPEIRDALCHAVCGNILVTASAGNIEVSPNGMGICTVSEEEAGYPGRYGYGSSFDCTTPCSVNLAARILTVGGTDRNDNRGDSCRAEVEGNLKTKIGEIYAPGWDLPEANDAGGPLDYGASWAVPLVSGCAAVLAATNREWKNSTLTPEEIHAILLDNADTMPSISGAEMDWPEPKFLNCLRTIYDQTDIAFVLDQSGSMGSGMPSRWDKIGGSAQQFATMISQVAPPNSRLGSVRFHRIGNDLTEPSIIDDSSNAVLTVNSEFSGSFPTGGTPLGSGLKAGLGLIDDPMADDKNVVVLFTDGRQNGSGDQVVLNGCQYGDGISDPMPIHNGGCSPKAKIITVGIDTNVGMTYHTILQQLASSSGGDYIVTTDGNFFDNLGGITTCNGTMSAIFDCALGPALYGNSPQMITVDTVKFSGGPHSATLPFFDVNKVSQLLVKVSLSKNISRQKILEIKNGIRFKRNSVDVTEFFQPIFSEGPTNFILFKTFFSKRIKGEIVSMEPQGKYSIEINKPKGPPLDYRVVVYGDDHRLDMTWSVNPSSPRVNQPFVPNVSLSWRGQPIKDATVKAIILQPGDDVGDLLAKHEHKVKDLNKKPDAESAGQQKYEFLLKNDSKFLKQLQRTENSTLLKHQGNGQYTASFKPFGISGVYHVIYYATNKSKEMGDIQRTALQSVYVRFDAIDPDNSSLNVKSLGTPGSSNNRLIKIELRPKRKDGRFIGPAQGSGFKVAGNNIRLQKVTDHQNGGYTLDLVGDPETNFSLSLLDEIIYEGQVSRFGKKNGFQRFFDWFKNIFK